MESPRRQNVALVLVMPSSQGLFSLLKEVTTWNHQVLLKLPEND